MVSPLAASRPIRAAAWSCFVCDRGGGGAGTGRRLCDILDLNIQLDPDPEDVAVNSRGCTSRFADSSLEMPLCDLLGLLSLSVELTLLSGVIIAWGLGGFFLPGDGRGTIAFGAPPTG